MWMTVVPHITKSARHTLGTRIENKFLDLLEQTYTTYFIEKEKKAEKISECILILDMLKFLTSMAWEGKIISNRHYEEIAIKLNEIGKMFGGWKNSFMNPERKNRNL